VATTPPLGRLFAKGSVCQTTLRVTGSQALRMPVMPVRSVGGMFVAAMFGPPKLMPRLKPPGEGLKFGSRIIGKKASQAGM
jgi:hypothetical protein